MRTHSEILVPINSTSLPHNEFQGFPLFFKWGPASTRWFYMCSVCLCDATTLFPSRIRKGKTHNTTRQMICGRIVSKCARQILLLLLDGIKRRPVICDTVCSLTNNHQYAQSPSPSLRSRVDDRKYLYGKEKFLVVKRWPACIVRL